MFSGTFNMMKIYNSRERKQTLNLSKRTVKYRNALLECLIPSLYCVDNHQLPLTSKRFQKYEASVLKAFSEAKKVKCFFL